MKKSFKGEKDLRLFVKNFLKTRLKGLPEEKKIKVKVKNFKNLEVSILMPFYSEGNLIRANEVDFLLDELLNLGIKPVIFYLDDEYELELE